MGGKDIKLNFVSQAERERGKGTAKNVKVIPSSSSAIVTQFQQTERRHRLCSRTRVSRTAYNGITILYPRHQWGTNNASVRRMDPLQLQPTTPENEQKRTFL